MTEEIESEQAVERQALEVDLRAAALACFFGKESTRWRVTEIVSRLQNLGISCTKVAVTSALAEAQVELDLSVWSPVRLVERGSEWFLAPKSELLELILGARRLPLSDASSSTLSDQHKAVLLVVIGHRSKGGISRTHIGDILEFDPVEILEELRLLGLVYVDPDRALNWWRPTRKALLALGYRSSTEIPEIVELEKWFDAQKQNRANRKDLTQTLARTGKLKVKRDRRRIEQRQSRFSPDEVVPSEETPPELDAE